eukprot:scaffold1.g5735.t1
MKAVLAVLLAGLALARAVTKVEWTRPDSGSLDPLTITPGESVSFVVGPSSNLYVVGKNTYDTCVFTTTASQLADGGVTYAFRPTSSGSFYFVSSASGDCQAGLKLMVTVAPKVSALSVPVPAPVPAKAPAKALAAVPAASPTTAPATPAEAPAADTSPSPVAAEAPATTASAATSAAAARSSVPGLALAGLVAALVAMLA